MSTIMLAIAAVTLLQVPAPHSETTPADSVVAQFSERDTSRPQRSPTPVYRTATGDRALSAVELVSVGRDAIDSTIETLRVLDAQGRDGVVLWIGVIEGQRARVLLSVVLVHDAADTRADDPLASRDVRARLNHALAQRGLRLIAEVHSGTLELRDSDRANRDVVADSDGALVFSVPNRSPDIDPTTWPAYRRLDGGWRSLSVGQMQKLLRVDLE